MIQGEIGLKINKIRLTKFSENDYEMHLHDESGGCFHIVGDNDLKVLLEDALNNIVERKSKDIIF